MGLLLATVLLTLWVLGIRDWRCYGLVLIWPPVISAIQTGQHHDPARARRRARVALPRPGVGRGSEPRREPRREDDPLAAAPLAGGRPVACAPPSGRWSPASPSSSSPGPRSASTGSRNYPDLLRRIQELEEPQGYTIYALATDLGAPSAVARALGVVLAVGLLAAVVVAGRRGDDRRAFALAIAAALACSPIVWLHYFALLLVAVAVAEPRLGVAWFAPLLMYASTGTHNGTTLQTAVTIAAAVLTIALAVRPDRTRLPRPLVDAPRSLAPRDRREASRSPFGRARPGYRRERGSRAGRARVVTRMAEVAPARPAESRRGVSARPLTVATVIVLASAPVAIGAFFLSASYAHDSLAYDFRHAYLPAAEVLVDGRVAVPRAQRPAPGGGDGVRLSAASRLGDRARDPARAQRGVRRGDRGVARARPRDPPRPRSARLALLRRRSPLGADADRDPDRERVAPRRVPRRARLALPRADLFLRGVSRARDRREALRLAAARLDARAPSRPRRGRRRRRSGRRDPRPVGVPRVRGPRPVSGDPRAARRARGREELLVRRRDGGVRPRHAAGQVLAVATGVALLAVCVVLGRRGDDLRSFTAAVAAALAFTPVIWQHYLVLLLVPLAVARPRFSALWLLPVRLWLARARDNGDADPDRAARCSSAAALVTACSSGAVRPEPSPVPAAARP